MNMRALKDRTIYQCEHCGKVSLNAGAMTHHERSCHSNPKNQPKCWEWCKHYSDTGEKHKVVKLCGGGYGYDGDYEEQYEYSGEVIVRKCDKLKVNLFTPLVGKWKKEKLLKEGWKEMPSIVEGCEHYCDLNKELKEFDLFKKL